MESCIEEFLALHMSSFHVVLWLAHYTGKVIDDRQGIHTDDMNLVLPLLMLWRYLDIAVFFAASS